MLRPQHSCDVESVINQWPRYPQPGEAAAGEAPLPHGAEDESGSPHGKHKGRGTRMQRKGRGQRDRKEEAQVSA